MNVAGGSRSEGCWFWLPEACFSRSSAVSPPLSEPSCLRASKRCYPLPLTSSGGGACLWWELLLTGWSRFRRILDWSPHPEAVPPTSPQGGEVELADQVQLPSRDDSVDQGMGAQLGADRADMGAHG